ncbi:MAG: glycosyltransferase [Chloroflexi bacterium]|nr:glycosyltransferase [Chloroflexota bacterium]
MILMVFTKSYPYHFSPEYAFLHREIHFLAEKFDKVILIPRIGSGRMFDVPPGVEVDESLSSFIRKKSNILDFLANALSSKSLYQEIRFYPSVLFSPAKLLKLILFSGRMEIKKNWIRSWLAEHQHDVSNIMLYSYWFDDIVLSLGAIKQTNPGIRLVSRAHGYDIYEELYFPYYWPCRQLTLPALDKLFPASEDGANYFKVKYPRFASIIEAVHLGVEDPGGQSTPSTDNTYRIVSCAHLVSLKRVGLLLKGIVLAARLRPQQNFEWIHFGGGKEQKTLERIAQRDSNSNLKIRFTGNVPNKQILLHYTEQPVDVFINVSKTEGGAPVSIQEAISCGIPVIATAVGGNPEIVSQRNGILLEADPTPNEIANAIFQLLDNPEMTARKRRGSREVWSEQYNADVNFHLFADRLISIREDQ